jgi:hypothetical protein
VLAPFWTDLDASNYGEVRIGVLTDGINSWLVVDWDGIAEFGTSTRSSFEIWIGVNGVEDITYAYGDIHGASAVGQLNVGAENKFGNRGQSYYFNGAGTLPSLGQDLRVTSTLGSVSSKVVTFQAKGVKAGNWVNYAFLTGDTFDGTNIARFGGTVTP